MYRKSIGLWYQGAYLSSTGGFLFVSAIATMWLFWLSAAACRLVIFPLAPFTLAYNILIWLWFSFFSLFLGSFLLFVIGGFRLFMLLLLLGLVPYGTVHGCCWVAACYLVSAKWASAPGVGRCVSLWLASFFHFWTVCWCLGQGCCFFYVFLVLVSSGQSHTCFPFCSILGCNICILCLFLLWFFVVLELDHSCSQFVRFIPWRCLPFVGVLWLLFSGRLSLFLGHVGGLIQSVFLDFSDVHSAFSDDGAAYFSLGVPGFCGCFRGGNGDVGVDLGGLLFWVVIVVVVCYQFVDFSGSDLASSGCEVNAIFP